MSPVFLAGLAAASIFLAGLDAEPMWRHASYASAVFWSILSINEALAMFRMHMNQVVLHRLSAQHAELMRHRNGEGLGAPDKPAT